jgi:hypothetical protein
MSLNGMTTTSSSADSGVPRTSGTLAGRSASPQVSGLGDWLTSA